MLNVFLTIDTEVWPSEPGSHECGAGFPPANESAAWKGCSTLHQDIERDIYGVTPDGEFGLRFQLERFKEYGLKATFFVESLFSHVVGTGPLREIVATIQDAGHDVQLHIHTDWLARMNVGQAFSLPTNQQPGRLPHSCMKDFSEDQQAELIERALERLRECGAEHVCAVRAGHYGANFDTLRALARNGIQFDTSHNTCYLKSDCAMRTAEPLLQPKMIDGVYEFPVNFFRDWPGHYRHTQLTACSIGELKNALWQAHGRGWYSLVIVSHSFELFKRRMHTGRPPGADRIILKRFEQFCRFLADNSDKFRVMTFSEVAPASIPEATICEPLGSNVFRTARRYTQQLARRMS